MKVQRETRQAVRVGIPARQASVEAVVIRCGCGDPLRVHPDGPCPTPRAVEDLGTVAYWHRNPLWRLLYRIARALRIRRFWR